MANLKQIEHIVVLMMENRSFDNVFGWLYDPANPVPFNREPPAISRVSMGRTCQSWAERQRPAGKGQTPTDPCPDPGEPYEDVYEQLYNVPTVPLNKTPPPPATSPTMQGFVNNYARANSQNPEIIMNCFTPMTVPVLSTLRLTIACVITGSVLFLPRHCAIALLSRQELLRDTLTMRVAGEYSSIRRRRFTTCFPKLAASGRSTRVGGQ